MPRFGTAYESFRPLIIWLGLLQLAWIAAWLLRPAAASGGYGATVVVWVLALLGWLTWVVRAGRRGFFLAHTRRFSNLAGVSLVLVFSVALFAAIPAAREGLARAAAVVSDRELASIHILRLLAVGTIIKYLQGQLPRHFVILGSVPDFLFAASAVAVTLEAGKGALAPEFMVVWHLFGMLLFLGPGIAMFLSVPSHFRIFHGKPDSAIVFEYPMLLAPNFTVPLFMLAHAFALVKLTG